MAEHTFAFLSVGYNSPDRQGEKNFFCTDKTTKNKRQSGKKTFLSFSLTVLLYQFRTGFRRRLFLLKRIFE